MAKSKRAKRDAAIPRANPAAGRALQAAIAAHSAGRLDEAMAGYGDVLKRDATHPAALANLASLHARRSEFPQALDYYRRALEGREVSAELCFNYANLQHRLGEDPVPSLERALRLDPGLRPAHFKLSRHLATLGQHERARDAFARALSRFADDPDFLRPYGDALFRLEDFEAALRAYERVAALRPEAAGIQNDIAVILRALGRLDEAEAAWRRAIALDPDHAVALANLGTLCRMRKRHEESAGYLRRAIALRPDDADAIASLSTTLIDVGATSEALGLIEPALLANPDHGELLAMKAFALAHQARIAEALEAMARARKLAPDSLTVKANSLFCALYSDEMDAQALSAMHREISAQIVPPALHTEAGHAMPRGNRPLRIGYLSPDFRSHPVAFFLEPVLERHDPAKVHVTCYSLPGEADEVSLRLRGLAHEWRDFQGWTLERMASQIEADGIDVLVDLAGYTARARMDLMARRAAPVQACFLGYPFTTGHPSMDYLIADRHIVPARLEHLYSERIARLEHSFLCYQPQPGAPEVAPLPALANRHITFGSFNNLMKFNDDLLATWGRLLAHVPGSRLALKTFGLEFPEVRADLLGRCVRAGIDPDRLDLVPPPKDTRDHLSAYDRIDVGLDTFPYHGTTTTCEAFAMGLPVVSIEGDRHVSRVGVSLLHALGTPELVARDADDSIRIAAEIVRDSARLTHYRRTIRPRLLASALCDTAAYGRRLTEALVRMGDSASVR